METELFPYPYGGSCTYAGKAPQDWKQVCFYDPEQSEQMNKKALILIGLSLALTPGLASAQPKYDPGATDTEIKIGNIAPYSGPVSLYGAVGKVQAAYFKMV